MEAPSPSHILRIHAAHVTDVSFSSDNEGLYSGDNSGNVVVTSTRTLRSIASWKAHAEGILSVQKWASSIITHGRDNRLHVWLRVLAPPMLGAVTSIPELPKSELCHSLDVNALNFCCSSLCCRTISGLRMLMRHHNASGGIVSFIMRSDGLHGLHPLSAYASGGPYPATFPRQMRRLSKGRESQRWD